MPQFADNERESPLNSPGAQAHLPSPPQARDRPPPISCPPVPFPSKTLGAGRRGPGVDNGQRAWGWALLPPRAPGS